ncbi:MAG: hypothetical protein WA191_06925 [Telluria sp.]
MKEADLTKSERYSLLLYRQGKPKSRALPRQAYADPSESVLFPAERAAREAKKKK